MQRSLPSGADGADAGRVFLRAALGLLMLLFGLNLHQHWKQRPADVKYLGTLIPDHDYHPSPHLVERLSVRSPESERRWPRRVTILGNGGQEHHFKVHYDERAD